MQCSKLVLLDLTERMSGAVYRWVCNWLVPGYLIAILFRRSCMDRVVVSTPHARLGRTGLIPKDIPPCLSGAG
jgi:hypothetical protein